MSDLVFNFVRVDLLPLLAGTFAAVTCGLLGNFLVLRRLSLMGDAISHAVLPGLVIAFLITGLRSPLPMFLGAAAAGVATVVLVELVQRFGRVEPGAAMGVVFSVLFALGVLLIEQAATRQVDLDAQCVLHGQAETLFWFPAQEWSAFLSWSTIALVPRQVVTLAGMTIASFVFVAVLFKELRIAAFDPELATTQGFSSVLLHYVLMIFIAAATVASFEAVGSILVIAMLICPAAAARLLTDRLLSQVFCSLVVALACGVFGYVLATALPAALGYDAVNSAGMMAVVGGGMVVMAAVFSPRHGIITKAIRRRGLALQIVLDDLLGALYRLSESGSPRASLQQMASLLPGVEIKKGAAAALERGFIARSGETIELTESGHGAAADIIRRHRLWESYLVNEAVTPADRVHDQAEQLEHVDVKPPKKDETDPHGRPIPAEPPIAKPASIRRTDESDS